MVVIITNQIELNKLIQQTPMINNIHYDNQLNYIPIDFRFEYVHMFNDGDHITLERIKYETA